ncbi:MAG: trigger factor [Bacteroidales bacterium]
MNISRENEGKLGAFIKIELSPADYKEKVSKTLKTQQQKAQIKGFRPGKVPFGLVEKMYGKSVLIDEVNKILSDSLMGYIEENKIAILGHPIPASNKESSMDFDNAENFTFWFELGLTPEFDINLDKLNVKNYEISISDAMVDDYIKNIRRRHGKVSSPEKASETDLLGGEIFELNAEGEIKEGGLQTKTSIAIDMIALKTIQKKFIGKKIGDEIDFNLSKAFKNDTDISAMLHIEKEEAEKLNGEFRFHIESITAVEEAELNEDLFKQVYPKENISTEADFREQIRKESALFYVRETDKKFTNDVIKAIVDSTKFEMPDDFLKRWLLLSSEDQKLTAEIINEEYARYAESLKWQIIENKIISNHNITVSKEDIKKFYKENVISQYFPMNDGDEEMMKRVDMFVDSMLENKEEVKKVYDMLYETKMTELFKTLVKIDTEKIAFDDFIALMKKEQN